MTRLNSGKNRSAIFLFFAATAIAASAQTFTTLANFNNADGDEPASLVQGTDGNFYGVTHYGGLGPGDCPYGRSMGCGTVFRVTPAGMLTKLYSFCSQANCADGNHPVGLVEGANGNFYGVTSSGGGGIDCGVGCGTVFEITPTGKLTTLYTFCSQFACPDGDEPLGGLVLGSNGVFYGTTLIGGAGQGGTVFAITATGKLTTLYSFCAQSNCTDGMWPSETLLQATNGKLYGSTQYGGAYNLGTIFSITTEGSFASVHAFKPTIKPGPNPLIEGADGNLYGTSTNGGKYLDGTVFRIKPDGTLTYGHSFCAPPGCTDGFNPFAGLVQGDDGNFYGTTFGGGSSKQYGGTVFEITPTGGFNTLYDFCAQSGCLDGEEPWGLIQSTNGNFYGIAGAGGTYNDGAVFELSTGLGPFVEATPGFSSPGKVVYILGNNLTATGSVTFNGTAARFRVVSDTFIKATVPTGATTGTIEVTTPTGTLSSNVPFHVVP